MGNCNTHKRVNLRNRAVRTPPQTYPTRSETRASNELFQTPKKNLEYHSSVVQSESKKIQHKVPGDEMLTSLAAQSKNVLESRNLSAMPAYPTSKETCKNSLSCDSTENPKVIVPIDALVDNGHSQSCDETLKAAYSYDLYVVSAEGIIIADQISLSSKAPWEVSALTSITKSVNAALHLYSHLEITTSQIFDFHALLKSASTLTSGDGHGFKTSALVQIGSHMFALCINRCKSFVLIPFQVSDVSNVETLTARDSSSLQNSLEIAQLVLKKIILYLPGIQQQHALPFNFPSLSLMIENVAQAYKIDRMELLWNIFTLESVELTKWELLGLQRVAAVEIVKQSLKDAILFLEKCDKPVTNLERESALSALTNHTHNRLQISANLMLLTTMGQCPKIQNCEKFAYVNKVLLRVSEICNYSVIDYINASLIVFMNQEFSKNENALTLNFINKSVAMKQITWFDKKNLGINPRDVHWTLLTPIEIISAQSQSVEVASNNIIDYSNDNERYSFVKDAPYDIRKQLNECLHLWHSATARFRASEKIFQESEEEKKHDIYSKEHQQKPDLKPVVIACYKLNSVAFKAIICLDPWTGFKLSYPQEKDYTNTSVIRVWQKTLFWISAVVASSRDLFQVMSDEHKAIPPQLVATLLLTEGLLQLHHGEVDTFIVSFEAALYVVNTYMDGGTLILSETECESYETFLKESQMPGWNIEKIQTENRMQKLRAPITLFITSCLSAIYNIRLNLNRLATVNKQFRQARLVCPLSPFFLGPPDALPSAFSCVRRQFLSAGFQTFSGQKITNYENICCHEALMAELDKILHSDPVVTEFSKNWQEAEMIHWFLLRCGIQDVRIWLRNVDFPEKELYLLEELPSERSQHCNSVSVSSLGSNAAAASLGLGFPRQIQHDEALYDLMPEFELKNLNYFRRGIDIWLTGTLTDIPALDSTSIVAISCGDYHTIALTSNGNLFTWGSNQFGQCGLPKNSRKADHLSSKDGRWYQSTSRVNRDDQEECDNKTARVISCTEHLVSSEKIISKNEPYGEMLDDAVPIPQQLYHFRVSDSSGLESFHFVEVHCGGSYSVSITTEGQVFTWGDNRDGCLGHGIAEAGNVVWLPMHLCGCNLATLLYAEMQRLSPNKGDLSYSRRKDVTERLIAYLTKRIQRVVNISAGAFHVALTDSRGGLWLWGQSQAGQLGFPSEIINAASKNLKDVVDQSFRSFLRKPATFGIFDIPQRLRIFLLPMPYPGGFDSIKSEMLCLKRTISQFLADMRLPESDQLLRLIAARWDSPSQTLLLAFSDSVLFNYSKLNITEVLSDNPIHYSEIIFTDVACGEAHTMAWGYTAFWQGLLTWGQSGYGQLGIELSPERHKKLDLNFFFLKWNQNHKEPCWPPEATDNYERNNKMTPAVCLTTTNKVRSIRAGGCSSLIIYETGRIDVWGANDFGMLGYSDKDLPEISTPTVLPLPRDFKAVTAVFASGSPRLIVISDSGQAFWAGKKTLQATDFPCAYFHQQKVSAKARPSSRLLEPMPYPEGVNRIFAVGAGAAHTIVVGEKFLSASLDDVEKVSALKTRRNIALHPVLDFSNYTHQFESREAPDGQICHNDWYSMKMKSKYVPDLIFHTDLYSQATRKNLILSDILGGMTNHEPYYASSMLPRTYSQLHTPSSQMNSLPQLSSKGFGFHVSNDTDNLRMMSDQQLLVTYNGSTTSSRSVKDLTLDNRFPSTLRAPRRTSHVTSISQASQLNYQRKLSSRSSTVSDRSKFRYKPPPSRKAFDSPASKTVIVARPRYVIVNGHPFEVLSPTSKIQSDTQRY